jgi:hypothetical protein
LTTAVQDKSFLVKILVDNLKWSHGSLNSFRLEELQQLYTYVLEGYRIYKAKAGTQNYCVNITVPKKAADLLNLEYGDLFSIKANLHKREVILIKAEKGTIKLGKNRKINFPVLVSQKKLLKENDETMVLVMGNRIILKSFTHMQ